MAIMVPVAAIIALVGLGGRGAARILMAALTLHFLVTFALFAIVWQSDMPVTYVIGGWQPPLGIALRADGISAIMMLTTTIVICGAAIFAWEDFRQPRGRPELRSSLIFWSALLAIGSALNTLFTSSDLFNLYVALELLTFAAIPIVSLKGGADTLRAALRYLLFAVFGSLLYLFGIVLIYGAYGTLEIAALATRAEPNTATLIAAGFVTVGLLAKTALFPFHLWLPPAHAGAPAAGSAILSALVVKGSLFLLVRLWFDALPAVREAAAMQLLTGLGAAAVIFGSVLALRQVRLKLLVAYSTVAQIGYMFFMFALVPAAGGDAALAGTAWSGGWLQVLSHAFAKAAMFMAAGLVAEALGHDRIGELAGLGRKLPVIVLTFAISGLSMMGIPPSGGFSAKWLLLLASFEEGQWLWAVVIIAGGLIAGGYVFRVLGRMMAEQPPGIEITAVARYRQHLALGLAFSSALLGFAPLEPWHILQIGRVP
jgi:formate hydrogenlyase subunit 3/multisubunit Na+/H+ antiporter MnhD subunit